MKELASGDSFLLGNAGACERAKVELLADIRDSFVELGKSFQDYDLAHLGYFVVGAESIRT